MTEREDLERRLREVVAEERAAMQARRDAVKLEWVYTIYPSDSKHLKSWDDTLVWYDIGGRVTNAEEAEAAGHPPDRFTGRMAYLFNTLTGKLVMNSGGGTVYIETLDGRNDVEVAVARQRVSKFLRDHPKGGDITEIVEDFKKAVGRP